MKRLVSFTATIILVVLLSPHSAYAICQKCNNDNSKSATCWTITNVCEQGATMSACIVKEVFNPDGTIAYKYCDPDGTIAGPECNGNDPSCSGGGGSGGTGGTGDYKGFHIICVVEMFEPCDFSSCDLCIAECWILC